MVEVYRTNISDERQADFLVTRLQEKYPTYKINFDLEDCDNILRVEGKELSAQTEHICGILEDFGFKAIILEDIPNEVSNGIE